MLAFGIIICSNRLYKYWPFFLRPKIRRPNNPIFFYIIKRLPVPRKRSHPFPGNFCEDATKLFMRKFFKDICVNNFTFLYYGRIVDWPKKQYKIRRFGHRSQPIRSLAEVVFGRTDWHPRNNTSFSHRLSSTYVNPTHINKWRNLILAMRSIYRSILLLKHIYIYIYIRGPHETLQNIKNFAHPVRIGTRKDRMLEFYGRKAGILLRMYK